MEKIKFLIPYEENKNNNIIHALKMLGVFGDLDIERSSNLFKGFYEKKKIFNV